MKVLELFSGTGSVGKVCKELGWEVVSLDLKGADINTNILDWDYTQYAVGDFDIIWASPPCDTFSRLRLTWLGRKLKCHNGQVCTKELLQQDIDEIGLPILRKTEEIIDYFNPKLWFIENPQTGRMKEYIDRPFYDVDYCKYVDWGYQKRTRIWTNQTNFEPKLCKKDCENLLAGGRQHKANFGGSKIVMDGDKIVKVKTAASRVKYKDFENIQKCIGGGNTRNERYRIPPQLIRDLLRTG
jgi:hypothetical protein